MFRSVFCKKTPPFEYLLTHYINLIRYISLLAFAISFSLQAQVKSCENTLMLVLKDGNNHTITGAEVFIEELHLLKKTDKNGSVRFEKLCDKRWELDIWYREQHIHHWGLTGKIDTLIFIDSIERLQTTYIKGLQIQHGLTHAQGKDISNLSNTSISNQLSELPTVRLQSTGNTIQKPILQGLQGLRLPLFQNGFRLETQAWGTDHAPELGRWGIQYVDLQKGANALKWGNGTWGNALNIQYKPTLHAFENTVKTNIQYGSNAQSIGAGITLKHGGSKQYNGIYSHLSYHEAKDYRTVDGYLPNTGFKESRITIGSNHIVSKKYLLNIEGSYFLFQGGIYLGSHIGNQTDLLQAISRDIPNIISTISSGIIQRPYQTSEHRWVGANWSPISKQGWYVSINWQRNQRKEFDPHRNTKRTFPQLNVWRDVTQFWAIHKQQTNFGNLEYGVQSQYRWQDWGGYYLVPIFSELGNGAFFHWNSGKSIRTQPWQFASTLRLDRFDQTYLLPHAEIDRIINQGVSAAFSVTRSKPNGKISGHLSYNWRPASASERHSEGVHHGSASYEQGNRLTRKEQGLKADLLLSHRSKTLHFQLNLYGLYSPDFIHLNPQAQPILSVRGAFPYYKYESIPTLYAGTYIGVEYNSSHWNISQSGDFIYGKLLNPSRYPTQLPPLRLENTIKYVVDDWNLQLTTEYNSKQFLYTISTDVMPPPDGYLLFHLAIQRMFFNSKNTSIGLFIDNVNNIIYRSYLDRFRYFSPQAGRNIRIQLLYQLHHHRKHKHKK